MELRYQARPGLVAMILLPGNRRALWLSSVANWEGNTRLGHVYVPSFRTGRFGAFDRGVRSE